LSAETAKANLLLTNRLKKLWGLISLLFFGTSCKYQRPML
jgi:hypothetical protein